QLALTLRALLRQDVVEVRLAGLEAVGRRPEALRSAPVRLHLGHRLVSFGPGPSPARGGTICRRGFGAPRGGIAQANDRHSLFLQKARHVRALPGRVTSSWAQSP